MSLRPIRGAVIGAGPAGIYAADILTREHPDAHVDLIERLPAPYGLVRYEVAPDHPRIKEVVKALRNVLNRPTIRFFGNVEFGTDLKLSESSGSTTPSSSRQEPWGTGALKYPASNCREATGPQTS